jgi:hypothetical protein
MPLAKASHRVWCGTVLEGLLGSDLHCQTTQEEVLAQLQVLEVKTQSRLGGLEQLWEPVPQRQNRHSGKYNGLTEKRRGKGNTKMIFTLQ